MTRAQIKNKLAKLVEKCTGGSVPTSKEEAFLLLDQEGNFDSVSALQLVFDVEENFNIVVEDDEIHPHNFRSLDALTDFVRRKVSRI